TVFRTRRPLCYSFSLFSPERVHSLSAAADSPILYQQIKPSQKCQFPPSPSSSRLSASPSGSSFFSSGEISGASGNLTPTTRVCQPLQRGRASLPSFPRATKPHPSPPLSLRSPNR